MERSPEGIEHAAEPRVARSNAVPITRPNDASAEADFVEAIERASSIARASASDDFPPAEHSCELYRGCSIEQVAPRPNEIAQAPRDRLGAREGAAPAGDAARCYYH
jgi:hypothetical protein